MPFNATSLERLGSIVEDSCKDSSSGIPGTTVVVVGKNGEELLTKAAGKRGVDSKEAMSLDSIYYMASCTKLLTGIAVMQLVEQGKLRLDDADQIEDLCPEFKTIKVLRSDSGSRPSGPSRKPEMTWRFEDKKVGITLRMLLNHTAGFGYAFFNERLRDWCRAAGVNVFPTRFEDVKMPLMFQPGEGWEYGTGVDWAGIALERLTGLSLNDYLQNHLFVPLGITEMTMIPSKEMRSRLAHMHARGKDGILKTREHLLKAVLEIDLDDETQRSQVFNSGGAGIFAKPQEYCIEEMFRNQVPDFPNLGRQGIPAAVPELTNPVPDLYAVEGNPPQGWGLTFMQSNGGATGRSTGTGHWAGLANTWWWCDRENGVAGMVCTQILPFADPAVLGLWAQVETEVYKALKEGK
ncbi:beta-lactamase/transpeptidase-like protein [Apiospora rasikravindrae]|uniref:Beta-lactamase/transpeptidase-like protein n=1 Tax=Apiospora rasikravindrae TaxID=990691 RepID=A0ABR1RSF4_9PEZI